MPSRERRLFSDNYGAAAAQAVQAVGGEGWFLVEDRGKDTDVFSLNSRRVVAGVSAEVGRQIVDDHNAAEAKRVADATHGDAARAVERESN